MERMTKSGGVSRRWFIAQLEHWYRKVEENKQLPEDEKKPVVEVMKENMLEPTISMTPEAATPVPEPPKVAFYHDPIVENTEDQTIVPYRGGLTRVSEHPAYSRGMRRLELMKRLESAGRLPQGLDLKNSNQVQALTGVNTDNLLNDNKAMAATMDSLNAETDMKYSQAYVDGADSELRKYGFSWADLAGFLPGGSIAGSLIDPPEGASRAEALALSGGGGLLGGVLGAGAGAYATGGMEGEPGQEQYMFNPMAALGGGLLGGGAGSMLGRWLAKRKTEDPMQAEQIKQILEALAAQKGGAGGSNITINMPEPTARHKEADNA